MALQLRTGLIDRTIAETAVGAAFGSDGVVGILTGGTIQNNTFPLTAEQSAVRIHAGQCRFSISGIFGLSPCVICFLLRRLRTYTALSAQGMSVSAVSALSATQSAIGDYVGV